MAKRKPKPTQPTERQLVMNELRRTASVVTNALMSRAQLMKSAGTDPRRNINEDCGYPDQIQVVDFTQMFKRNGFARRVVGVLPEECWAMSPEVYDLEEQKESDFEAAWKELAKEKMVYHFLHRLDMMSGIGHFGLILMGFDDGRQLDQPLAGIGPDGKPDPKNPQSGRKLLFMRVFDEYLVQIAKWNSDIGSPRFGQPELYRLTLSAPTNIITGDDLPKRDVEVHWTRILHFADNCLTSEVFGDPRQEPVFNWLCDTVKIYGGAAEGFWQSGFPGYSFEAYKENTGEVEIDSASIRQELFNFQNGLQRFLALEGGAVKTIGGTVSSPDKHIDSIIKAICITTSVPVPVFIGSEEAKLNSNTRTWNKRLDKRRQDVVSPKIVCPFVERMVGAGVLPPPKDNYYKVAWPDLDAPTTEDRAKNGALFTEALVKYVSGGVSALIPPLEYFTNFLGIPLEEAEAIIKAAEAELDLTLPLQNPVDVQKAQIAQDKLAQGPNGQAPGGKPGAKGKRKNNDTVPNGRPRQVTKK